MYKYIMYVSELLTVHNKSLYITLELYTGSLLYCYHLLSIKIYSDNNTPIYSAMLVGILFNRIVNNNIKQYTDNSLYIIVNTYLKNI